MGSERKQMKGGGSNMEKRSISDKRKNGEDIEEKERRYSEKDERYSIKRMKIKWRKKEDILEKEGRYRRERRKI